MSEDRPGTTGTVDPLDVDGPAAPPRANGELVFTAPWQSRLFATTMRLQETGRIEWEDFRRGLIEQIGTHEQSIADTDAYDYWGCWQRSLERLLARLDLVEPGQLQESAAAIAALPPGHDHGHGHDHSHEHEDGHGSDPGSPHDHGAADPGG